MFRQTPNRNQWNFCENFPENSPITKAKTTNGIQVITKNGFKTQTIREKRGTTCYGPRNNSCQTSPSLPGQWCLPRALWVQLSSRKDDSFLEEAQPPAIKKTLKHVVNSSGWPFVGNEGMNPHPNHVWFHSLIPY